MDEVLEFMVNKEWEKDDKAERKIYLLSIARKSSESSDVAQKIGGMLIYNQIIEQLLREIIVASISYIKAEIWPMQISLNINLGKMTMGNLTACFEQNAIKERNCKVIIKHLKEYTQKRNAVVHNLFGLPDIETLSEEIDEYDVLAEKIILLLLEYYNEICMHFYDLDRRVEFDLLYESFAEEEEIDY